MSKYSKRKHLVGQVLGQEIDELTEKQSIVKVVRSKGNNLHEVESPDGEVYLMSMPTKFRNVAFIKIGDFVLAEAIDEGDKVRAQMVNIILNDQIPDYVKRGMWPERFMDAVKTSKLKKEDNYIPDDSDDDEMFRNVNRPAVSDSDDDDDDDEDDSECESEEKG